MLQRSPCSPSVRCVHGRWNETFETGPDFVSVLLLLTAIDNKDSLKWDSGLKNLCTSASLPTTPIFLSNDLHQNSDLLVGLYVFTN